MYRITQSHRCFRNRFWGMFMFLALGSGSLIAQTFTESMGTAPATTAIATHEAANAFDNDGFTMTGTADVRNTSASTGYSGASGLGNIFITNIAGRTFQIEGINTSAVTNPVLSFGINKSTTASNGSDFLVEVSSDGIVYTAVSFPALPTGTGTAIWHLRTVTAAIPQVANLRIRFTNTATATQYRIDDVSLSGINCAASITAGGPTTFCAGGSVALTANAGSSYLWSTGATTQTITVNSSGTYSVTVTNVNNCSATASVTVTVNPLPTVAATASLAAVCAGNSSTLTATGASTYLWQPGNHSGSTFTVTPAVSTTYTVTGTNANGCTATATVSVTVNPNPTITVSNTPVNVCQGGSATLTASGASTYVWQPGSLTGNSITVTPASSITYTVTGTDANGCVGTSDPIPVLVYPTPVVIASAIDSTFCVGDSTMLNVRTLTADLIFSEYVEGTSNEKYIEIYNGTGATVNLSDYEYQAYHNGASSPTFTTALSGTLADGATLVLKNGSALLFSGGVSTFGVQHNGDDALALFKISTSAFVDIFGVIGQDPGAAWTGTPGYSTVDFTLRRKSGVYSGITVNSGIAGAGGFTTLTTEWDLYPVNTVSGLGSHAVSGVYSWAPATNPSTGSSVSATPSSTTTYTVTGTYINGCSGTDDVTITVNPLPVVTISGDNTICTGESTTLTAAGATTYVWSTSETTASVLVSPVTTTSYSVTGTDANGCSASASETVTVNPLPTVAASASPATICAGDSATLTATGASTYTWQPGSLSGSSVSVTPSATTTYTVTGTDANGCSASASETVTVNPLPTVAASASPAAICAGSSSTLSATGAATYSWQPGSLSGSSVSVTPSATTTYTVTGTDANGCSASASETVTVNSLPAVAASASPTAICAGSSSTLSATGAATYSWQPGSLSGSSVSVTPSATTTYTVTGTDANGCTASASAIVTVNPLPTVAATASPATVCTGQSSTLTATGATTYTWQPGSLSGSSVNVTPSVTTTYTVTGTSNGCSASATRIVTVVSAPVVTVTTNRATIYDCYGQQCATLTSAVTGGSGTYTYIWSTGATTASVNVCPNVTTTYTVIVTDITGCTATTTITINVIDACCGYNNSKVIVCLNGYEFCIRPVLVPLFLYFGGTLGECPDNCNNHAPVQIEEDNLLTVLSNPVTTTADIRMNMIIDGQVLLEVKDIQGRTVEVLQNGDLTVGTYQFSWTPASNLAPGVYFCDMTIGDQHQIVKIVYTGK